jgi:hypothetical protein
MHMFLIGAIFMSMPLAILGNEYDKAWTEISEEEEEKQLKLEEERRKRANSNNNNNDENNNTPMNSTSNSMVEKPKELTTDEKLHFVSTHSVIVLYNKLIALLRNLNADYHKYKHSIHVSIIIGLCDLRAWLQALTFAMQDLVTNAQQSDLHPLLHNYIQQVYHGHINDRKPSNHGLPMLHHQHETHGNAGANTSNPTNNKPRKLSIFASKGPSAIPTVHISTLEGEETPSNKLRRQMMMNQLHPNIPRIYTNKVSPAPVAVIPASRDINNNDDDSYASESLGSLFSSDEEDEDDHHTISTSSNVGNNEESEADEARILKPSEMLCIGNGVTNASASAVSSLPAKTRVPFQSVAADESNQDELEEEEPEEDVRAPDSALPAPRAFRSSSQYFNYKMARITQNPKSLKSRIWMLLELPQSSFEARLVQLLIIVLLLLSILMLYTQTITTYTLYGEHTEMCESVVSIYCSDKHNPYLDPGCFVQPITDPDKADKLKFFCKDDDCYRHGWNFGSPTALYSCNLNGTTVTDDDSFNEVRPFQSFSSLQLHYTLPSFFPSRELMHKANAICERVECTDNSKEYEDISNVWIVSEVIINSIFTVEIMLRLFVSDSFYAYILDKVNIIDWIAILPFYIDIIRALSEGKGLDFSILSSSPRPIFFVAVRSIIYSIFFIHLGASSTKA